MRFDGRGVVDRPRKLPSEEMREGLRNNQYEYVTVRALGFQRKRLLKRAFEDAIKHKAKARKNGKPALAETYKILANSLYGVFGQRTKDMETVLVVRLSQLPLPCSAWCSHCLASKPLHCVGHYLQVAQP